MITRKDLDIDLERLRGELQRFILLTLVLVASVQILVIKTWR